MEVISYNNRYGKKALTFWGFAIFGLFLFIGTWYINEGAYNGLKPLTAGSWQLGPDNGHVLYRQDTNERIALSDNQSEGVYGSYAPHQFILKRNDWSGYRPVETYGDEQSDPPPQYQSVIILGGVLWLALWLPLAIINSRRDSSEIKRVQSAIDELITPEEKELSSQLPALQKALSMLGSERGELSFATKDEAALAAYAESAKRLKQKIEDVSARLIELRAARTAQMRFNATEQAAQVLEQANQSIETAVLATEARQELAKEIHVSQAI